MKKIPNFFIVGAAHSGTTSFYEYLKTHTKIFMSPIKEPNYFSPNINKIHKGLKSETREFTKDEYLKLFSKADEEKVIGEATTRYLTDPGSAQLIHNFNPDSKILILLRDPIERVYTHYFSYYGNDSNISFSDLIRTEVDSLKNRKLDSVNLIWIGCYFDKVKKYFDAFGEKSVKILIFEEVFPYNIRESIKDSLNFLGINDIHQFEQIQHNQYYERLHGIVKTVFKNKPMMKFSELMNISELQVKIYKKYIAKKGKKPPILEKDREFLIDFYKSDVGKLENLLKQNLPWQSFF